MERNKLSLRSLICEDLKTHREGIFAQGFWAIFVYRLSNKRISCRYNIIRKPWKILNIFMQKLIELFCGISIPETTIIGRRLNIEHFGSIIIHGATIIGDDCIIRQGVTIGNKSASRPMEAPRLGNRVDIGAGAKILGPIVVGDGAVIGANAVVTKDVMENAVMAGIPAQLIRIQATPGQGSAD